MAKYLKDVLGKNTTTKKTNDLGVYKPKAGDEQKFVKKHEIEVHDHTPAPEYQFSGGKSEAAYKKQSDGVYESKKAEDVSCNHTPAGTKCPIHEMADCSTVRNIKELSTDLLHRAAHKAAKVAMTDVQGRSGPIFKKRAAQANKFRDKGMAQEKKEKAVKEEIIDEASIKQKQHMNRVKTMPGKKGAVMGATSNFEAPFHKVHATISKNGGSKEVVKHEIKAKDKHDAVFNIQMMHHKAGHKVHDTKYKGTVKEEALDEISKKTLGGYIQGASRDLATRQYNLGKGDKSNTGKIMNRRKGIDKAADKLTNEGANVDRMVAHVKSSEKAAGKSDKKAESIAWATANKRGMLDNKNKKTNEDLAVPLLQGDSHSDEAVEMVKAELKALANKAMHLVMQMPSSMHVEPWCQAKIAQAKSMINDVHDYMVYGNHQEEDEQADSQMQITPAASPGNTLVNPAGDPDRGRIV